MRLSIKSLVLVIGILFPIAVHAKPLRGFHEGPYLLFSGGILQYDWDQNQIAGIQQGSRFEPAAGFQFGWHMLDWLGLEVQTRYTTNLNKEKREHIVTTNIGPTFTLLIGPFLDFTYWRILPFIKPSIAIGIANLPADPAGAPGTVSTMGFGASLATGVHMLYKYFYFGIELQEDFIAQPTKIQPGTGAVIYQGGWKDQFGAMGVVGVHY